MRSAALLLALATAAGVTGCAALSLRSDSDPRVRLQRGVVALQSQEYARARTLLEPLYREHWEEEIGQRALLLLAAAELDSRNPSRRLWAGADMAARLLGIRELEPWLVPVTETYYLVALELGAQEERLAQADSARAAAEARATAARNLPASGRESVPVRVARVTTERDALRRRVNELEQTLAVRERELRETRQELERIKQTIKN